MNPNLVKATFKPVIKQATKAELVGRTRDHQSPEKGRFTKKDVTDLLGRVWQMYDELAPHVPQEPKPGNQMNMLLSCITLACFRILMAEGIGREYAIELIGDMTWKIYKEWGRIPIFGASLITRDPRERMRMSVNMFLRFPFTPPGYVFKRLPSEDGISFDVLRCPVAEYLRQQNASDLCVSTWCDLDFPLAEMWGGWLERTTTLASGCAQCDFRFKVGSAKAEQISA